MNSYRVNNEVNGFRYKYNEPKIYKRSNHIEKLAMKCEYESRDFFMK